MEAIIQFFIMALTAAAAENMIFSRALGLNKPALFISSIKMGILYGVLMTAVSTVSSVLTHFVILFFDRTDNGDIAPYLRPILFVACVGIVYGCVYLASKKFLPGHFKSIDQILPLATFNSALFGAIYVSFAQRHTLAQAMGYAFGMGAGFTLAMAVVFTARKRLAISQVPRAFKGMPIILLYIGLLSLAIYGLVGHELPT